MGNLSAAALALLILYLIFRKPGGGAGAATQINPVAGLRG